MRIVDLRGDSRIMRVSGTRNVSQINRIARHHSATAQGDVFAFQNWWRQLGWITGGYHYVILRDGTVQWVYDDHVIANGVGGHNTNTIHVCLVGSSNFTAAQEQSFDAIVRIIRARRANITIPNVWGHREFSGHAWNTCPGINMVNIRARLSNAVAPPPPPAGNLFPVGTIVQFSGGAHHASSTATTSSGSRIAGRARVTALAPNARNQYHLVGSQGGAGAKNSNVHGWVQASLVRAVVAPPPPPTANRFFPATSAGGGSIVAALNAINVDSSFNNRARIARANGISNYSGTAAQNTNLLNLLRQGRLIRP